MDISAQKADPVLKLAILAVGGQGGGVLSDWIVEVAERNGYVAQSTSVAGVAQRTGATIYYVEMAPRTERMPVFALSPSPGDVDILIAAELMEAGRAIMRGFVTERTTLIASSHRIAAVSEKIEPGDGRAASDKVHAAAQAAAGRFVAFDMERIAVESGSVISASLFGALAGCGVLPFAREAYEETIKSSGRGVKASLAAFAGAYERALGHAGPPAPGAAERGPSASSPAGPSGPQAALKGWEELIGRVERLPEPVQAMAQAGLQKVVDYQDLAYGTQYLDRLDQAVALDPDTGGHQLSIAAAKYVANAMCYDDIIRVADLKTRARRSARVRRHMAVKPEAVLRVTEFFHPRVEEFCGTLPAPLGRYIEDRPKLARFIDRMINKGRRVRTDTVLGFGTLWMIAGLRRFRRGLLRHGVESAHLERWYGLALETARRDVPLATEILGCRRLIKGYSDTHARGLSKYDRVLSALPLLAGRPDAADWLRRLREAALKDEAGAMLDGALKTVATLDAAPGASLH